MQLVIAALTLTVFVLVELQVPLEVVKVSVKEHVEVPALTVTVAALAGPTIEPFPLMLHK